MLSCIPFRQFRTVNIAVSKIIAGFQRFYTRKIYNILRHTIEMQKKPIKKRHAKTYNTLSFFLMRNHPVRSGYYKLRSATMKKSLFTIRNAMIWLHNLNHQIENRSFFQRNYKRSIHRDHCNCTKITEPLDRSMCSFFFLSVVVVIVVITVCI